MKHGKGLLAILMVLLMVVSMIPNTYINSFATEVTEEATVADEAATEEQEEVTVEPEEEVIESESEEIIQSDPTDSEKVVSEDADETEELVTEEVDPEEASTEETWIETDASEYTETYSEEPAMAAVMASINKNQSVSLDTGIFYRIFHLDAGRKYFSMAQIKEIIDQLAANNYTHLELALGNDALRFMLDDMSVTANGTSYSDEAVTNGVIEGNKNYYNDGNGNYLSESEMDSIIAYAKEKNVGLIPLINTPGHMDSIIDCMESLGISNPAYNNSARTVDVTNAEACNFTLALVEKYIEYFAGKGVKIFNMGCDEYANDVYSSGSMGFGALISNGNYDEYITYVNNMAAQVQNAGMVAMAFNDGIYFNNNKSNGTIDSNIAIAYWTSGWSGYTVRSAANLVSDGFKIINTNDGWYYVLGRSSGTYGLSYAKSAVASTAVTSVSGSSSVTPAGCMACVWCDTPSASYSSTEVSNLTYLISTLSSSNTTYFTDLTTGMWEENTTPVTPNQEVTKTDSETGITVTAIGLTGLNVVEKDTASYSAEGKKVIGYDITPKNADGDYSGDATVTIPVPTGWDSNDITVYDVKESKTLNSTVSNGVITFEATHFSEYDLVTTDSSEEEYTSEQNVSVSLGGTSTVTVEGVNYAGTYTTTDPSIATVSVTGQDAQEGTLEWTSSKVWYSNLAGSNTSWTKTSYYYNDGDNYYPVWAYRISGYYSSRYYVGYTTDGSTPTSGNIANYSSNTQITLYQQTGSEPTPASTTITFTGKAVGTTSVIIGGVKYNITVVDTPPSGAMTSTSLTLEYWITNYETYTTTSKTGHTTTISSSAASTDDGVDITEYAPSTAYSFFDGTVTVYYWQSMRLTSDHKQTNASGDDETSNGTTFTKVRYHAGVWQYYALDGTWNYFLSTDQAVAYYLQKTDVTSEVTTYMKDWGYSGTSGSSSDTSSGSGQVDLSVAVVYPDGTVSPSEDSIFPGSSVIFNYWSGRDIGIVAPANNSDYDISKITYTYGTRTDSTSSNTWNFGTSKISWNKTTTAAGTEWYDETTVWDTSMGTTPVVNGAASNITWSAKNTGVLILIYLTPVHKDTNLTVKWMDDSDNYSVITSQEVVVDSTSETKTFTNSLIQNSPVRTGSITLDDDAYVTNSSGVKQTFNKDLTTMQNIDGKYSSGLYYYKGAEISEDGMTLVLHYGLDTSKASKQYVVDFGLPVTVKLSDLIDNTSNITTVATTSNVTYDSSKQTITYTPSKAMTTSEAAAVTAKYSSGSPATVNIGFVPATTVYYEEGFASYTGTWTSTGSKGSGTQAAQLAGSSTDEYGFDAKYDGESAGPSNGTCAESSTKGASSSFTFTGSGVDLYANCSSTTGSAVVRIKDSNGNNVKSVIVNTVSTQSIREIASTSEEYNLPIVSVLGLDYGTYTVDITIPTDKTVSIDGYRVYGTLQTEPSFYVNDNEDNPNYYELRDLAITYAGVDKEETSGQVHVEIDKVEGESYDIIITKAGSITSADRDLVENGPKNELFLAPNSSIALRVTTNREVQIGLKAVDGATSYMINQGTEQNISSTTDMFHTVLEKCTTASSQAITITNTGSHLLSITKLKVCDDPNFSFGTVTESDLDDALISLGLKEAPKTEADAGLTINLTESGKTLATTSLSETGYEGETATFAAADILAAAKAVLPSGYTMDDATVKDVEVAYGETDSLDITVKAPVTTRVATLKITYKRMFGGKTVGTVTLTKETTSTSATKATFSASEIKAACPKGYTVISASSVSVKYGATSSKTVYTW